MKFGVFTVLFANKTFEEMLDHMKSSGLEQCNMWWVIQLRGKKFWAALTNKAQFRSTHSILAGRKR
ncbi:sugar phosphate isomerase/epimerase [Bacillus niacini]|uniref:Sugar phosphate isomerase/epimerase n=1 Tax=Neobacillus niacini TaxID=86668 RepID=A0A852TKM7_9BACI|nr:hypothetical protein [Neobacillus niacini]NYE08067.1 sugar phosphate isomerase/epimerase [Neobacillus niacini]